MTIKIQEKLWLYATTSLCNLFVLTSSAFIDFHVQFTSLNDIKLHFLIRKQYPTLPSAYSTD